MIRNRILLFLLAGVFFTSCTAYHELSLEVLRTGEARLPATARRVGFLYRNFRFPGDTLQHYFLEDGLLRKTTGEPGETLDSLLVTTCLESAALSFRQNGLAVEPLFFPADIMPPVSGEKLTPLPPSLVQKLAQPAAADHLIVLETFSWFFSRFTGERPREDAGEVAMAGIWALYDGATGKITETRSMVDTLYWQGDPGSGEETASLLPPRTTALEMASAIFGESYAQRFYPGWITVDRMMVIPPTEEFRQAAEHAVNQEWPRAEEIWKRYASDRFGRLAVTARYNLALAAESNDRIGEAVEWILRAQELADVYNNRKETTMVSRYRQILETRQKEISLMESWEK